MDKLTESKLTVLLLQKHVVYRLTKKNDDKDKKKEALHKRTKVRLNRS